MGAQKTSLPLKKKIVLVDDHSIMRQALASLINEESDLKVCGQAGTAAQAMEIIESQKPDLAIVDLSLKGRSGLELIKTIKSLRLSVPVLVLSMHEESLYAERALHAGARGYVMKQDSPEKLISAIHRVLQGEISFSSATTDGILQRMTGMSREKTSSPYEQLSDRELEVFELIGQGYGTSDIAGLLKLSAKTIEYHRENIKRKLNVTDATQLRRQAIQWVQTEGKFDNAVDGPQKKRAAAPSRSRRRR